MVCINDSDIDNYNDLITQFEKGFNFILLNKSNFEL